MSAAIFMEAFAADIRRTILDYGEDVTFKPKIGADVGPIRASVQSPLEDSLIGDADQQGFVVYVAPDDLPAVTPLQFDRLHIRGKDRTIQEVHPTWASGVNVAWMMKVLG